MMIDRFRSDSDSVTGPARVAYAITPHDTQELAMVTKAVCIGASGTLCFRAMHSTADVTLNVVAGQILPVRISHIRATGTTAAGLVGLS